MELSHDDICIQGSCGGKIIQRYFKDSGNAFVNKKRIESLERKIESEFIKEFGPKVEVEFSFKNVYL